MEKDKINLTEIKKLIPHREPFLFIDELANIEKLNKATGIKNLDFDSTLQTNQGKKNITQIIIFLISFFFNGSTLCFGLNPNLY